MKLLKIICIINPSLKITQLAMRFLLKKSFPNIVLAKHQKLQELKEDIKKLAHEYAKAKRTYIRPNYGLNRHRNGGMMTRTIMLLPAITGAWKYKESGCFVGSIEEMWNVDLQKLQRPDLLDGKNQDQLIWFK